MKVSPGFEAHQERVRAEKPAEVDEEFEKHRKRLYFKDDLKKDLLVQSYEKLGDENRKLVNAFVEGLMRVEEGATETPEKEKKVIRRGGPETAPLLYADRQDKREKVVPFIIRVYGGGDPSGGWLDGNMTRADLRHLDPKGYAALNNFETRAGGNTPLSEMNLPTVKQQNDALIEAGVNREDFDPGRRVASALYRRTGSSVPEL